MRRLVLASASPARRFLLESAGLFPEVVVSAVDEDGTDRLPPTDAVLTLAERKGRAVAERIDGPPALVVACDSMLSFDGETWGKASSPGEVTARWRRMRGRSGHLYTGHVVIDTATGRSAAEADRALIRFGNPTDAEIASYAETGESLQVAGPFTLEGRSAPWIDSIEGNYGTVTGLSLVVLRRLLARLGVGITDLWA